MALKVSDASIYKEIAALCFANTPSEVVEKSICKLSTEEIRRCAQTVLYHPFYTPSLKHSRFQDVANGKSSKHDEMQEKALSELFFKRMWCFQRSSYFGKGEICIQYARKEKEHPWLDKTFNLSQLCLRPGVQEVEENCQYSFWSPNFADPRLFCWSGSWNKPLDGPEWSYESDAFTRCRMDGRWGPHETNHPQKGRTLRFLDIECANYHDSVKDFTPCTLGEMSNILFQLSKTTHQVYYRVQNIRTEDLDRCKLYQSDTQPTQYCLLDRSSSRPDSFCSYPRRLIQKEGVWVERQLSNIIRGSSNNDEFFDLPDRSKLCIPPVEGATKCHFRLNGNITSRFTRIDFPQDPSPTLGLQFEKRIESYGFDQLVLRTITPMMVLPEEAEEMARYTKEFLLGKCIPASLFNLVLTYWNLPACTLPKSW